jgi:hypothetical protein
MSRVQEGGNWKLEIGKWTGKKMETGKWKPVPPCGTTSSQFPVSSFQFQISNFSLLTPDS